MACKITHSELESKPIVWGRAKQPSRADNTVPALVESALNTRLAELEQRMHVEVTLARKSGFEEGLRQAKAEDSAEISAAADRLAHHLKEVQVLKNRIRNEAEAELVRLALAIARRVLNRELTVDPDSIQGIAHAALQKLQQRELVRIRVHASGVASIKSAIERCGLSGAADVSSDPSMGVGDLVLETARGELDASVDTQLREIARGFADRLALP